MADGDIIEDDTATFQAVEVLAATYTNTVARSKADAATYSTAQLADEVRQALFDLNSAFNGAKVLTVAGKTLRVAGAPATGWDSTADDLALGNGADSVGISGFSPVDGTFKIVARDADSNLAGYLEYQHTDDIWVIGAGATSRIQVNAVGIAPRTNGGASCGIPDKGFSGLVLAEASEPSAPSSGRAIAFLDSVDGEVKAKLSDGTVKQLSGGGGSTVTYQSFINHFVSQTSERMPQWYTNAGNSSTVSVFTGASPAQVEVMAPFGCTASVQLRGATATAGDGWGVTTVRLYTERSDTVRDSDTFDFTSDVVGTFDLSGHAISAGDMVAISMQTSSADGVMMVQLVLTETA